jgi:hypothetical protein
VLAVIKKSRTVFALTTVLVIVCLCPSLADAQTPSSYVSPKGRMSTSYTLLMYSPNNQTTYDNRMLLNFTLKWTADLIPVGDFEPSVDYAYSIDNNSFVSIVSNESLSDSNSGRAIIIHNPESFSYLLNISNLNDGYHKIVIKASFYFGKNLFLDASSSPFPFLVQNQISPNPSIPEFSWLAILPLFMSLLSVAVMLRHRKTVNLTQ